jgi:hypothetical protein
MEFYHRQKEESQQQAPLWRAEMLTFGLRHTRTLLLWQNLFYLGEEPGFVRCYQKQ